MSVTSAAWISDVIVSSRCSQQLLTQHKRDSDAQVQVQVLLSAL